MPDARSSEVGTSTETLDGSVTIDGPLDASEDGSDVVAGEDALWTETDGSSVDADADATDREEGDGGVAGDPDAGDVAPVIIRFSTNVRTLTEGEHVLFSLVATDPQGIDDLIGGTLDDPSTGSAYGTFATSASEGSYSLSLTWSDIDRTRPIEFTGQEVREFEATLFDAAAHSVTARASITLACASGAACSGRCASLTEHSTCGSCANSCEPSLELCVQGTCVCDGSVGARSCGQSCVVASPFRLDACGSGCATCPSTERCDGFACTPPADGDLRIANDDVVEAYHLGEWRGVCSILSIEDLRVACWQMGMGGARSASYRNARRPGSSFWIVEDPGCEGSEARLEECPFFRWGTGPSSFCDSAHYASSIDCDGWW